jgi:archaellum component FlaF (FlaF/FlaG flagellin family)
MRLFVIAATLIFLTILFAQYERGQREVNDLLAKKTKLEIEKLEFELPIYREQYAAKE